MDTAAVAEGTSVYVHVPFCASRCDYCAFATWTERDHLMDGYVAALCREISGDASLAAAPADTVFFGGGTPSRLEPGAIGSILAAIPRRKGAEVSLEANPQDVTPAAAELWRGYGVTRLSLGIQSFDPSVLRSLGRAQDPAQAYEAACVVAEAGFDSWSLDLVFGAAAETAESWQRTLESALSLSPPHLSAYGLTVEPGTALQRDPARHPDEDFQADLYQAADAALGAAGLGWYEVSNWARPGERCRHNLHYWRGGDYRGFGCAAHSRQGRRRWWNLRTPERYIAAIGSGASPVAAEEVLDGAQECLEALMTGIRTEEGVAWDARRRPPGALEGLVELSGGRLRLSLAGRLLANEVLAWLAALACP